MGTGGPNAAGLVSLRGGRLDTHGEGPCEGGGRDGVRPLRAQGCGDPRKTGESGGGGGQVVPRQEPAWDPGSRALP